jgi:hypothetical protein
MKGELHQLGLRLAAVEDAFYKINYASSIVVLVAERLTDNDESSALWSASDLMRDVISSTEEALSKIRQDLWVLKEKAPEAKKRGRPAKKASKK